MVKKITKCAKFAVCCALIMSLVAPSYAALSASDGSAFVTKAEFDSALADFNARITTFEAGINSKIDSQVTSYLDRNGIWNGRTQEVSTMVQDNIYSVGDIGMVQYPALSGGLRYYGTALKIRMPSGMDEYLTYSATAQEAVWNRSYTSWPTTFTGKNTPLYLAKKLLVVDQMTKSGLARVEYAYKINAFQGLDYSATHDGWVATWQLEKDRWQEKGYKSKFDYFKSGGVFRDNTSWGYYGLSLVTGEINIANGYYHHGLIFGSKFIETTPGNIENEKFNITHQDIDYSLPLPVYTTNGLGVDGSGNRDISQLFSDSTWYQPVYFFVSKGNKLELELYLQKHGRAAHTTNSCFLRGLPNLVAVMPYVGEVCIY